MGVSEHLQAALGKLNAEQREAVECLDGPLLVIAGPGTGKTQLLSLRAANILAKRDVTPGNLLCLTYTDAGAEAMRKRLIELVGRDAYGIQVSTFHGFSSGVRSSYPDYFARPASSRLATSLCQAEFMDAQLKRLPFGSPLSGLGDHGVARNVGTMLGFVSRAKRSGLSYGELERIADQTIDSAVWLKEHSSLCELVARRATPALAEGLEAEVERACAAAPQELVRPVVVAPGAYVPFIVHFRDAVRRTQLVDEESGKTAGYQAIRNAFFGGNNKTGRVFLAESTGEKLKIACQVAARYQAELDARSLYDYDDMIFDFVRAVEHSEELQQRLQDAYSYIQIDEFQDTNGAQMRIVDLLCQGIEHPNVMAVGDDDQAIMRFQGASIECVNQFEQRYRPRNIVLKTNYRSTQPLVELGQSVAAQVERRLAASEGKQIVAAKQTMPDDQQAFRETVFHSKAEEYAALAASIRERIDSGYAATCAKPDEAIAVIAPKHASLRALIPHLVARSIPFSYRQTQDLFTSERMQATLAAARCIVALSRGQEELAESFLPHIIAAPEFGGSHESSVRFALTARRDCHHEWLLAMEKTGDKRIRALHDRLMEWAANAETSPVRELLFQIAERPLAYYRRLSAADPLAAAEFNAGMRALLRFAEGEIACSRALGRAMRLGDVADRLDAAQAQGIGIDAGIALDAPEAVRLVSAHSSKGLEFDCVYLLDADDSTWHRGASSEGVYPSNLLFGDAKDEDDARRLLFVAATRAKRNLELYRAQGATLRELSGAISSTEIDTDPLELDAAIEVDWHDSYRLDTPELLALLDVKTDVRHLSASSLNAFVTYEQGCVNSMRFPERQVLRLPEAPSISLEFGTIVHAMLEDLLNRAMGEQQVPKDQIIAVFRQQVAWMDFDESSVSRYLQRFDRICDTFVPWMFEHLGVGRRIAEKRIVTATLVGTPLYGCLDLLLIDDEAKTVRIIDYKTGFTYEATSGYERQLAFYKLLVERSGEFEGYRVASLADCYVEPAKDTDELYPPIETAPTEEDVRQLERLADAVWTRIESGNWDTSAFEQSSQYEKALAAQTAYRTKKAKAAVMQQAYEDWLMLTDV